MKAITPLTTSQIETLLSNLSFEAELCSEAIQAIATRGAELTQVLANPYSIAFAWARFIVEVSQNPYQVIPIAVALATAFLAYNDISTLNTNIGLMSACEYEAERLHRATQISQQKISVPMHAYP